MAKARQTDSKFLKSRDNNNNNKAMSRSASFRFTHAEKLVFKCKIYLEHLKLILNQFHKIKVLHIIPIKTKNIKNLDFGLRGDIFFSEL